MFVFTSNSKRPFSKFSVNTITKKKDRCFFIVQGFYPKKDLNEGYFFCPFRHGVGCTLFSFTLFYKDTYSEAKPQTYNYFVLDHFKLPKGLFKSI